MPINASRNNMECEDRYCTTPASKKGFYRMTFNIEFEDSSSCNLYNPAEGCTFVNSRDAKEALGFHYKAWDKDQIVYAIGGQHSLKCHAILILNAKLKK